MSSLSYTLYDFQFLEQMISNEHNTDFTWYYNLTILIKHEITKIKAINLHLQWNVKNGKKAYNGNCTEQQSTMNK